MSAPRPSAVETSIPRKVESASELSPPARNSSFLNAASLPSAAFTLLLWLAPYAALALAQGRAPIVSAVDLEAGPPPTSINIAGRRHLAYELHITNFSRSTIALSRVEVLDVGRGAVVGDFSRATLDERLARIGSPSDASDQRVIAPGMQVVVYFWLPVDAPVPSRLAHRVGISLSRGGREEHVTVSGAVINVRREAPIALSAPLRGGPWVALYDPLLIRGHRTAIYAVDGRARIPARFAIDWVRVQPDGNHAHGDQSRIANWYGDGEEVLAVADGTVLTARDDIAEAPTLGSETPIPLENDSGNNVSLDLGGGRYVFYEHLKHGSVVVMSGDRVKRGQVLGQLGNSGGSSSGPHLHLHLADAGDELAGEGLPFVLQNFRLLGAYDTIFGFRSNQRWQPSPADLNGDRRRELPPPHSVVVFPRS